MSGKCGCSIGAIFIGTFRFTPEAHPSGTVQFALFLIRVAHAQGSSVHAPVQI